MPAFDDLVLNPLGDTFWGGADITICNFSNFAINLVLYFVHGILLIMVVFYLVRGIVALSSSDSSEDMETVRKTFTNSILAAIGMIVVSSALYYPINVLRLLGVSDGDNPFLTRFECSATPEEKTGFGTGGGYTWPTGGSASVPSEPPAVGGVGGGTLAEQTAANQTSCQSRGLTPIDPPTWWDPTGGTWNCCSGSSTACPSLTLPPPPGGSVPGAPGAPSTTITRSVNVMTFNTLGGDINNQDGKDGRYIDMANKVVRELILGKNIDVAVFQEVDNPAINKGANIRLESVFYQQALQNAGASGYTVWQYGNRMIISKWPMTQVNNEPQIAKIQIDGTSFYVANFHPGPTCDANLAWYNQAMSIIGDKPHILAGDFNINYANQTCNYSKCDNSQFTSCYDTIGNNYTVSNPPSGTKGLVDYVMGNTSTDWNIQSTEAIDGSWRENGWSDHNPVIATVSWTGLPETTP